MLNAAPEQVLSDEVAMLLGLCARQDGAAFRELYERESPLLYGIALRITRRPSLASDAVHDAMLQVWRSAARFDPTRGNARAWLASLVRYRALDIVARIRREAPGLEPHELEQIDPDPDPLTRLQTSRDGEALHRCLGQVGPERRHLITLAFMDGLSHAEVAARVGLPLGTVKSGIRRTLAMLRMCLGQAAP